MTSRDFAQIDEFLKTVGHTGLFGYYKVGPDLPADQLEAVIKKRRAWAQGQQANPKYRAEALWLIKNNSLVRRVLLEQGPAYRQHLVSLESTSRLAELTPFIQGVLAGGASPAAVQAVLERGRGMGLAEDLVRAHIRQLQQQSAPAATAPRENYYDLLGVAPGASVKDIEAAHRAKYRLARSKKNKEEVSRLYEQLDQAWRVLRDPERRAAYDKEWGIKAAGDGGSTIGYLPPPKHDVPVLGSLEPPRSATPKAAPTPPPIAPAAPSAPAAANSGHAASAAPRRPRPATPKPASPRGPARPARPPVTQRKPAPQPPPVRTATPTHAPRVAERSAPAPQGIGGRTLGLGARRGRRASPKLELVSPAQAHLELGAAPLPYTVVVKNAGSGRMSGRVMSDADWVSISPKRLNPELSQQEISVVVDPGLLPDSSAVATITVLTDQGERCVVTLDVQKKSKRTLIVVGAAAGVLLLLAVLAAVWFG